MGAKYAWPQSRVLTATTDLGFPFRRHACTIAAVRKHQYEGDEMYENETKQAVLEPGEGEVIEARGSRVVIKVATAGQLLCEYSAPEHFPGPPLHMHPGFDETFMVLDGRLEVQVRDQRVALKPGAVAFVSGNVPHTFRNPDGDRARFLLICTPGGFEHYFRALAAGDEELMAAISERFGYRAVELVA
jgi:mannose-6-phosphate isomerase-like protein (cupin superfamily)